VEKLKGSREGGRGGRIRGRIEKEYKV